MSAPTDCLEHLCPPIGQNLAIGSLGMIPQNGHWEWLFQDYDWHPLLAGWSTSHTGLWASPLILLPLHIPYRLLLGATLSMWSQHKTSLGALLLISGSSDQTVTPLIKEWSNWRLRRQNYEYGSIMNYFYEIGMLHSEDLTQWNIWKCGIGFLLSPLDVKTGITVYQQMPLVTLEDMTLFRPIKDKYWTSQEMDSPTKVRGRTF